eukprot:UN31410
MNMHTFEENDKPKTIKEGTISNKMDIHIRNYDKLGIKDDEPEQEYKTLFCLRTLYGSIQPDTLNTFFRYYIKLGVTEFYFPYDFAIRDLVANRLKEHNDYYR